MPPKKIADFDSKLIGEIAEIMSDAGLTEVELTQGDSTLRLSKQVNVVAAPAVAQAAPAPVAAPAVAEAAPPAAESAAEHPGTISSPMVGTVYLSSSPGADHFVSVGSQVKEGDTMMIIEAMKVMNPIPAPRGGTVKAIIVSDTQPVEFGDPLIIIE
ncbi:MAG: acetyl-CoA carboxylase biotin carboxyl carrier protein [Alphaproteobacteria bacterium]|nr:acetyl-CoA carboxylase biotin carboxyl carrier protein [Alphaproteobacteria bacterium]MCK5621337.1 acetyl-CoA carboxylase biotin carboxyl carrier protein [Alphaproteobacteria bacterium]